LIETPSAPADGWRLEGCPWRFQWSQEEYILSRWRERKNGHYSQPGGLEPAWLREGLAVIGGCEQQARSSERARGRALQLAGEH